jgi:hypothetical protein
MKNTHRVVTFLTREEMDFLDKLEKDMMFSTRKSVSRSQIIEDLAELLKSTGMNAEGIASNEMLKAKILEAIVDFARKEQAKRQASS